MQLTLADNRLAGSVAVGDGQTNDFRKDYEDLTWTRIRDRSEIPSGMQVSHKLRLDLEADKRKQKY